MLNTLSKRSFSFAYPCPRKLREIVKMSVFERENSQTIEMLWTEYHKARTHTTSKVLSVPRYMQLLSNAQAAPFFILPVPKLQDNSHFVMVTQNQQKSFVMTWIDEFKKGAASANPYLVLTCFDELCRSKEIALVRGDVISHLSRIEGQVIMEQIFDCYLDQSLYEKVKQFNHQPNQFDH